MEKIDENPVIINKAACNIWIAESSNWNCVVIHIQQRITIDVEIFSFCIHVLVIQLGTV